MKKPNRRSYYIVATDTVEDWRSVYIEIFATSREDARALARIELARSKRDHWSIDLVVEGEAYDRTG